MHPDTEESPLETFARKVSGAPTVSYAPPGRSAPGLISFRTFSGTFAVEHDATIESDGVVNPGTSRFSLMASLSRGQYLSVGKGPRNLHGYARGRLTIYRSDLADGQKPGECGRLIYLGDEASMDRFRVEVGLPSAQFADVLSALNAGMMTSDVTVGVKGLGSGSGPDGTGAKWPGEPNSGDSLPISSVAWIVPVSPTATRDDLNREVGRVIGGMVQTQRWLWIAMVACLLFAIFKR
jgi:hypothetical protein